MSTPQPNRMKIVVSPLSVPQSVLKGPSDDEYRSETSLPRTSLSRLPEKRVLQPSLVENTDENLSPSTSKKPCLRVSLAVSESNADLKAEIGKLQEKIAWMASTRGSEVNSGLRLADLQEELRQERENSAKLKVGRGGGMCSRCGMVIVDKGGEVGEEGRGFRKATRGVGKCQRGGPISKEAGHGERSMPLVGEGPSRVVI